MKRCRCGKRKFDQLGAMLALADIARKDRPGARECRSYRCPSNPSVFHLTSHSRRRKR